MTVINPLGKKHIQHKEKNMGKGSGRRVEDVTKIRDNWDLIFGKKDIKEEETEKKLETPAKEEDSTKTK
jgi:hypothetical protein